MARSRVSVPSATRSNAGKKAAETKKANKECEKKSKSIKTTAEVTTELTIDSCMEYIDEALREDELTAFKIKELLEKGLLSALVNGKKDQGASPEDVKKQKFSPSAYKWNLCPVFVLKQFVMNVEPELAEELLKSKKKVDYLSIVCHALHVHPEQNLPWKECDRLMWYDAHHAACKHMYKQLGSRLQKGVPKQLDFFAIDKASKSLVVRFGVYEAKVPLGLRKVSEKAEIQDANIVDQALFIDKPFRLNCLELCLEPENQEYIKDVEPYLLKHSLWDVPNEVLNVNSPEVGPSDSASNVGSMAASTSSSTLGKKRVSAGEIEEILKGKVKKARAVATVPKQR
mmetsp:Transcript_51569/g.122670  ORF Transcript_51569/g.122670 Transcript_51569/m.122670 type:complete len:342 (+) Transcript_51569:65-1090(+)